MREHPDDKMISKVHLFYSLPPTSREPSPAPPAAAPSANMDPVVELSDHPESFDQEPVSALTPVECFNYVQFRHFETDCK